MKKNLNEEINSIKKLMYKINLNESFLNKNDIDESAGSKTLRGIAGLDARVNNFIIVTAQNPNAQVPNYISKDYEDSLTPKMKQNYDNESNRLNNKLNKDFEQHLKTLTTDNGDNYGFRKIEGKYGIKENTYYIPNLSKDLNKKTNEIQDKINNNNNEETLKKLFIEKSEALSKENEAAKQFAMELCDKLGQESVIFGEKKIDLNKNLEYMVLHLMRSNGTDMTKSKDFFISSFENITDFYSQVGNKQFTIPFYDYIFELLDSVPYSKGYRKGELRPVTRERKYKKAKLDLDTRRIQDFKSITKKRNQPRNLNKSDESSTDSPIE